MLCGRYKITQSGCELAEQIENGSVDGKTGCDDNLGFRLAHNHYDNDPPMPTMNQEPAHPEQR